MSQMIPVNAPICNRCGRTFLECKCDQIHIVKEALGKVTRFETPAYDYDRIYGNITSKPILGKWMVLEYNITHCYRDGIVCRTARLKIGRWCFTAHWHGADVCVFVIHRGRYIWWELPSGFCIRPEEEGLQG